jgi:hypothetical protein
MCLSLLGAAPSISKEDQLQQAIMQGNAAEVKSLLDHGVAATPKERAMAHEQQKRTDSEVKNFTAVVQLLQDPIPILPDYFEDLKKIIAADETTCEESACMFTVKKAKKLFISQDAKSKDTCTTDYADLFSVTPPCQVVEQLFKISDKQVHLLFIFNVPGHIFLIEKKSDETGTWWRIYQSWSAAFSLGQWLGINAWDADAVLNAVYYKQFKTDAMTQWQTNYGQGKRLNRQQIIDFLQSLAKTITETEETPTTFRYTIHLYTVDPAVYAQIPKIAAKLVPFLTAPSR